MWLWRAPFEGSVSKKVTSCLGTWMLYLASFFSWLFIHISKTKSSFLYVFIACICIANNAYKYFCVKVIPLETKLVLYDIAPKIDIAVQYYISFKTCCYAYQLTSCLLLVTCYFILQCRKEGSVLEEQCSGGNAYCSIQYRNIRVWCVIP